MTPNQKQSYQLTMALIDLGVFVHKWEVVDYLEKLGFFETPDQKLLADKILGRVTKDPVRKTNFKDFLKKVINALTDVLQ